MRVALAAFTAAGWELAERVRQARPHDVFSCFDKKRDNLAVWVAAVFKHSEALLFIGAAGIAVRLTAPCLRSKDRDPAVLVMDEKARYVIPLLSGHIGGANRLALELAEALGAEAVLTTATDLNGVFAVDLWATAAGCAISDIGRIKNISAALLAGETAGFHSDFPVEGPLPEGLIVTAGLKDAAGPKNTAGLEVAGEPKAGVCVSLDARRSPWPLTLNVVPRLAVLGAGCKKGTSARKFEAFALEALARFRIAPAALRALVSIDLKRDEACLLAFAAKHRLSYRTFSAKELAAVPGRFQSSEFVRQTTGVDNVCERAALAGLAGQEGRLIIPKTSKDGMTLALAVQDWVCRF